MKKININDLLNPKTFTANQRLISLKKTSKLLFLFLVAISCSIATMAQTPSYGNSGFNNSSFDQVPFASGSAYPSVMTANNVAGTGWSFHIGAIGAYVITQLDRSSTSTYNGTVTATNVTPSGFPVLYQTFAFTSTNNSLFKLNSIYVKIDNSSASPIPMLLAGVVNGQNTGSTINFVAMPGSNWIPLSTATNPNFTNINGVIIINVTGSTSVAEMSFDDINIAAPIVQLNIPSFTTQPVNKTICAGTTTTFSGVATNAAYYSWLVSTDGLIWNPITSANAGVFFSGYNTNTLTVSNTNTALNGLYLGLTAVNSVGVNKGSNAVRLFVNSTPIVPAIGGSNALCVGSSTTLTNATPSGVWRSIAGIATVNSATGVVTGNSAGTATIRYTVTSGSCSASAQKNIVVTAVPAIPSIGYKAPFSNPQAGAPTGGFCVGKVFGVAGSPVGGTWSATGIASITSAGIVTINAVGAGSITYTTAGSTGCVSSRTMSGTGFVCAARGATSSTTSVVDTKQFSMYPNPAKSFINITQETLIGSGNITITDLYGKTIKNQPLSMGNNIVNIANITKGIYFISTITNEGKTTKKLIIE